MSHRRRAGGANDTQLPPNQHKPPPAPLVSYRRRWRWHGPLLPILALLTTTIATGFHRFLARFSGRRRIWNRLSLNSGPPWALLVLVATSFFHFAEACSSRTTPKPRPPTTQRPNITFHTYICPPAYDTWYCLNGATCFTVKIQGNLLYNCECADGYMGPRCEYKDLDGSYIPSQRRFMLETASIAGGATIAVFLVVILCVVVYVHIKRKAKQVRITSQDCVDGPASPVIQQQLHPHQRQHQHQQRVPTFGTRHHKKHHHHEHEHEHEREREREQSQMYHPNMELPLSYNDRGDGRTVAYKEQLQQVTTLLPPPSPSLSLSLSPTLPPSTASPPIPITSPESNINININVNSNSNCNSNNNNNNSNSATSGIQEQQHFT